MQAFGIGEVVVKNGPNSALVAAGGEHEHVPVPEVGSKPIDMLAAGDASMPAIWPPDSPARSREPRRPPPIGSPAQVIRHPGAILPRAGAVMH